MGGPTKYYPYGQERQTTPQDTEKFATYYRDSTGLDYAWNRQYTPTWGRFMQADPYVSLDALKNPQGWNRYAYVVGDPVSYYDPGGLEQCRPDATCVTVSDKAPDVGYDWMLRWYRLYGPTLGSTHQGQMPVLDPWFEAKSATQLAAELKRSVVEGAMTDCEALAAFATEHAMALQLQGVEISAYFVQDFGVFVDSDHPLVRLANIVGVPIAGQSEPLQLYSGGESGFKPEYRDVNPRYQDQVHHFAAFCQFGYFAGERLATLAAILLDLYPDNPGDRALGQKAGELGAKLRKGEITVWAIGFHISELCR